MTTAHPVSAAERIADDLVDRSMDFLSIRDMLIAAASAGTRPVVEPPNEPAASTRQLLLESLGLTSGAAMSEVRERLVRRALDRDGWRSRGDTYRVAVDVVLEALGVLDREGSDVS